MQHLFDVDIAKKYGVNLAIFLKNVAYWINYNRANNQHFYDGRYWTFNTLESFSQIFPYWTVKQIRTIIAHAIANNLLMKGEYNKVAYDKTLWYSLTDLGHEMLNLPICPNGQMDVTEWADRSDQKGTPIPYNKHNNKHIKSRGDRKERDASSLSSSEPEKPKASGREVKPFEPDAPNLDYAHRHGLDIKKEIESFLEKNKKPKTQANFMEWLKRAKEYKERTQRTQSNESKCTLGFFECEGLQPKKISDLGSQHLANIMNQFRKSSSLAA